MIKMDDRKQEDMQASPQTDNTRLEELMKQDITQEMQKEFFEVLKQSQLFMPVTFNRSLFDEIENAEVGDVISSEEPTGFNINYLTDSEGRKAIPLFTSAQVMESVGLTSSLYAIYMSDLADMLRQTDKYSVIAVNPFTSHDINIPVDSFINLFNPQPSQEVIDSINTVLKMLDENSIELDDEYGFYLRSDEDIMKNRADDGVYTANLPLSVNSKSEFEEDMEYLDIILMPKGFKILFFGTEMGKTQYNTIIAPGSQFEHVEDLDDFTSVWRCVAQPFYDE